MLRSFFSLVLLISLVTGGVAHAAGEPPLRALLGTLSTDSNGLNSQQQQQIYEESLSLVDETEGYQKQADTYQNVLENFVELRQQIREQSLRYSPPAPSSWQNLNLQQLNALLQQRLLEWDQIKRRIDELRGDQLSIEQDVSANASRTAPLKEQLSQLRERLDQLQFSQLNEIEQATQVKLQLQQAAIVARLNMLNLASQSAPNRNELKQQELQLLERKQLDYASMIAQMQRKLAQLHRDDAARLALSTEALSPELLKFEEVQQLIDDMQGLNRAISKVVEASVELQQDQQQTSKHLNQIKHTFANFNQQVQWLKVTRTYGEYLREQVANLPAQQALEPLEEQLVSIYVKKQLHQEKLYRLQSELSYPEVHQQINALPGEQAMQLRQLIEHYQQLLEKYLSELDSQLFELARLKRDYSELNQVLQSINNEANKQLFWTPDIKPLELSLDNLSRLRAHWWFNGSGLKQLWQAFESLNGAWYLLLAGIVLLQVYVRRLSRTWWPDYLRKIDGKLGNITRDKFQYTLINLLCSMALASPTPLFLFCLGSAFASAWEYPAAQVLGQSLIHVSWMLGYFFTLEYLSWKNGLLNAHFKWPLINIEEAMRQLKRMVYVGVPIYFLFEVDLNQSSLIRHEGLSLLIFVSLMLWICYCVQRMSKLELPVDYKIDFIKAPQFVKSLVWNTAILLPLLATVAAGLGYLSTSFMLYKQVVFSLVLGTLFWLAFLLVRRWMLLQRRRIAFERARQRRIELIAQRAQAQEEGSSTEGLSEAIEEPVIDLDTISAQSLGLLRTSLLLTFIATLLISWSEMTSAFSFLDSVTLWEVNSTRGGLQTVEAITLRSLGMVILILALSLLLVRNLPGLLELMLLQHLSLSPGTGFAITTVINYLVILGGMLSGFGMLGIEWSKLQWLVAALTVGLGFGLQEIFANFISGLIILFERPVRLGDTVTIRELTGTITKIETRATTIMDWDRKEIIVPNKAFITEQFVNWSLTDPITRTVLSVEVKHPCDIEQVTGLIQQAVEETSLVLENPTPETYFMGFTNNGARFEMRVYVSEMAFRLPMTHDLFSLINDKFKANNIAIAYPQVDISLNSQAPVSLS